MGEFDNKTIMVTGGTRGIGRAVADALLAEGARVAVCARDQDNLDRMAQASPPERFLGVRADVSSLDDLRRFHQMTRDKFGPVYGLVNNAGTAVVGALLDASDKELSYHLEAKLFAYLRLSRMVLPDMFANGGGSIVNIAGAAGIDPTALVAVAGIVNAAVQNMSRMMADEVAEKKVRVNVVNPGTLDTDLGTQVLEKFAAQMGLDVELLRDEMIGSVPLGRIPVPPDIAAAVLFFLSERSAMITGGQLAPDGGILIRRLRG